MPKFHPLSCAQRVIPSHRGPFIASMNKHDMERFARRILDDQWPDWKACLLPDGRVDTQMMNAKLKADDFNSGSASLTGAHGGRFWATARQWSTQIYERSLQVGDRCPQADPQRRLYPAELAILFGMDGESAHHVLQNLGIKDVAKALARSVIHWLPDIEEWGAHGVLLASVQ